MTLREGGGVRLSDSVLRLEFGRRAGSGVPRAEVRAVLLAGRSAAVRTVAAVPRGARPEGDGGELVDALTVDLGSLESAVRSVRLIARTEGGPLGRVPGLWVRVHGVEAGAGADWEAAAGESQYVVGECVRRGGGWWFSTVPEPVYQPVWLPEFPTSEPRAAEPGAAPPGSAPGPVTLTEAAPAVPLPGSGGALSGTLRVGVGLDGPGESRPGFDLCALFELSDGSKGVVQSLGGGYGSLDRPPFILLDGAGSGGAGATVAVNLGRGAHFRRVLVFAAVYERARSFAGMRAAVTLRSEHGPPVDFSTGECAVESTACALALLIRDGAGLVARREAVFLAPRQGVSPQRMVDYAYGWGLQWTPGRK
jgi:tellurite resistance protein TerA